MKKKTTLAQILSMSPKVEDRPSRRKPRSNSPVAEHIARGECRSNPKFTPGKPLAKQTDAELVETLQGTMGEFRKLVLMELGRRAANQFRDEVRKNPVRKGYPGGSRINAPWTAQKLRNKLVKDLGITKDMVETITDNYRFVSGFVDLRSRGLPIVYVYLATDLKAHDNTPEGYARIASSLKDYTGGQNHWTTWKGISNIVYMIAKERR